jgi:hypothetical protein
MVRIRTDKQATPAEAGFGQIAQRCAPPSADATSGTAPPSDAMIATRRVWTAGVRLAF